MRLAPRLARIGATRDGDRANEQEDELTLAAGNAGREGGIARPELADRIGAALGSGSVLVVAGAGFGKTMAVQAALSRQGNPATWIHCTEADHDARHLLVALMQGLRTAAPGVIDVLADGVLASRRAFDVEEVLSELAFDLRRLLPGAVTIVFDDAERLAGSPQSLALVAELIAADTGLASVAVLSRHALPFKLARARAEGRFTELGAKDLAFSASECAELLRLHAGRDPSATDVESLFTATEGWPLGVALAARTGVEGELAAPASAATLLAFLDEEVLNRLAPGVRKAIVDSSIVEELSPGCVEALGFSPGFLASLSATGLGARITEHGAIAHHPLVRELLLQRLAAERPAQRLREMHARVALAVAADGREDEAVEHWLAAEAWDEASDAISARGLALAPTAPATVRGWLRRLPAEHRSLPACLLLSGTLEWAAGDNAASIVALRRAVEGFRDRGDGAGEWFARFALADPLSIVGAWEEGVALAEGFEEAPPGASQAVAAIVGAYATTALGAMGRVEECRQMSARLLAHPGLPRRLRSSRAVWEMYMNSLSGDLDGVIELFERKLTELDRTGFMSRRPLIATGLSLSLGDLGREDEALIAWQRTGEIAQRHHMAFLVDWAGAWRALIHARAGRRAEAEAELASARVEASAGWRDYVFHLARARIAALRGDAARAVHASERAVKAAASGPLADRFRVAVELAPLLHAAGQRRRAEDLLAGALKECDARVPGRDGDYWRAIMLATSAGLQGEEDAAMSDVARAWSCAGDNAAAMVRYRWPAMEPLLTNALARRQLDSEQVIAALAEAFPGGEELLGFLAHPAAPVRRAALLAAAASGHPDVAHHLDQLKSDADPGVAAAARAAARTSAVTPALTFNLLGGFTVLRGRHEVKDDAWQRRGAQRLVRLLLVRAPSPVPEDELFETFWPDSPPSRARRSLQVTVSCARAVLDMPDAASAIEVTAGTVRLRLRDEDVLDTDRFERAACAALRADGDARRRLLERAGEIWTGEPLPEERYAEWTTVWRERLTDRFREILAALVQVHREAGDHPATIVAARRLVELDPLDESAQRELIAAYARAGRRAHALRQYLECRRVLSDALGVEPDAETAELQRRTLAGERL